MHDTQLHHLMGGVHQTKWSSGKAATTQYPIQLLSISHKQPAHSVAHLMQFWVSVVASSVASNLQNYNAVHRRAILLCYRDATVLHAGEVDVHRPIVCRWLTSTCSLCSDIKLAMQALVAGSLTHQLWYVHNICIPEVLLHVQIAACCVSGNTGCCQMTLVKSCYDCMTHWMVAFVHW